LRVRIARTVTQVSALSDAAVKAAQVLNEKSQLQTMQSPRNNHSMSIFLPDPLTREELTALKAIAVTPPLRGLPYKIQRRLVDLGFAQTVRGGLMATEDGLLRIQLSMKKNLRD